MNSSLGVDLTRTGKQIARCRFWPAESGETRTIKSIDRGAVQPNQWYMTETARNTYLIYSGVLAESAGKASSASLQ